VKHGSVAQIHTRACPRTEDGSFAPHRCKGTWRYTLEYGRDSTGRRMQTGRAGFPTRAAAQQALQDVVRTLLVDVGVHSVTVAEYLDTWLTGKHALKPKTVELYRTLADNYLVPHLGDIKLLELRAQHLDRMYAAITVGTSGRPLSPSTIRRVHGVLRSALTTAVKRRLIPYSPAEHIELAPENPRRPKPWTIAECQAFLAGSAEDRLAPLYELILATGLRRGEALGLRWEDVDLDGGALYVIQQIVEVRGQPVVGTPKTKHGARVVSLDTVTVATLRRHRAVQDLERSAWGSAWNGAGLVFTREDGRGLRPQHATKHFAVLAGQLGLPVIRVHDLRHTHASVALAAGVDLKVVSERLGHSQISITADLYTHVSRGVSQAAADKIAGAMRGTSNALPAASLQHEPESTEIGEPMGEERARPPPGIPAGQRP